MPRRRKLASIGSIVINFLRPELTIKCIESLRTVAPELKLYVGDQDDDNEKLKSYCEENHINYTKLPFDCGIGLSRNTLIEEARKDGCKYIMWGDNDFVYDFRFRVENALKILEHDKTVGIVGGAVIQNNRVQHYERIMYYNKAYRTACFIPLEYTSPEPEFAGDVDYYYCDMTFNFCVARIGIFSEEVCWDNEIKVKYEHSFFFLKFLEHSDLRVAYCPSMMVHHVHLNTPGYNNFRYRVSDGAIYARKLSVKTGFSINSPSWDYETERQLDFKKAQAESKPMIAAQSYYDTGEAPVAKLDERPQEIILADNSKPNFETLIDLIQKIKELQVDFVVLGKSCLDIVNRGDFSSESKSLHLGSHSINSLRISLLQLGFQKLNESEFAFDDYRIRVDFFTRPAKLYRLKHLDVKIPLPVVKYLETQFGRNWRQL